MAKRFKLKIGDVFTIPIDNNEFGIGQIVYMPSHKHNFIMIVFDKKYNLKEDVDFDSLKDLKILFLGYTVDAKLYHKHWEIIGNNLANLSSVKFPFYKLGLPNDDYPDGARLVDHEGNVLASIDKYTFENLSYESEVAPIRFQNALKAHFGMQEWISDDYDKILYKKTLESVKIAENILSLR
ncbi:Imm26 family immunity protein [Chryseobacterium mucoviscidosis]|uniref:Imm26 family immunity protein n=1 Tax=Chryseobacterium mucoviscidosis TaxID=1945581 RepID=UPI003017BA34